MPELTPEQLRLQLQETIRAAEENRPPDPAAWGCPDDGVSPLVLSDAPAGAPAGGNAAPRLPDPADLPANVLTTDRLGSGNLVSACEWYEIAGSGMGVWVYPCSGEEAQLVFRWAPHVKFDLDPSEGEEALRERLQGLQVDLWALQVIAVCRTGPERKSSQRCFRRPDLGVVRKEIPYEGLKEIVEISTALAKRGKPDTEALRGFFDSVATWLARWPSGSSTGSPSPDGWEEERTRLTRRALRLGSSVAAGFGTLCEAAREE